METQPPARHTESHLRRRDLLKAGLVAGVTLSAGHLAGPAVLWGAEAGPPRRGGILRVRGWDPVHFDPQLTRNFKTNTTLSFVYSTLLRHKVGAGTQPGTFTRRAPPGRTLGSAGRHHLYLSSAPGGALAQ